MCMESITSPLHSVTGQKGSFSGTKSQGKQEARQQPLTDWLHVIQGMCGN